MPKLLITGGSGYLGRELIRQVCAAQRWDITATYSSNPIAIEDVKCVRLDLKDEAAIAALIQNERPEAIIHTAYVQRGPDTWAATAEGSRHVAKQARHVGARLIHMSSDALFDGESERPYVEEDLPSPITPYGEAKAAAERFVATENPEALIVRTSLIYGGAEPGSHEKIVLDVLNGINELVFFTDELRNPVQVGDLATALLELLDYNGTGVLHIAGEDTVSRYEFACLVARAAGRSPESLRSGLSVDSGMRRPRNVAMDSTRAKQLLRTRLRGIREVLGSPS